MTVFVLDASALLRYNDNEAGADRVEELLSACALRKAEACISAVQWGEVAGNLRKRFGAAVQTQTMESLNQLLPEIVPATPERAVHAAALKVERNISYADAFALELALDSPDHLLVTADYDFKSVADLARIEFLPGK